MIHNRLLAIRRELGLTQQEVADMAQIDRTYYVKIEKNGRVPSLPIAFRLARVLGRRIEDIFFEGNVRKHHETQDKGK